MTEGPALTVDDVAKWMADKLAADGILYQADAVDHITTAFGPQFLKGNSINPNVRARFAILAPESVFHPRYKAWEPRGPRDEPGRRQYV
jgi:hypothetical protein